MMTANAIGAEFGDLYIASAPAPTMRIGSMPGQPDDVFNQELTIAGPRKEIVFIEDNIADIDTLVKGIGSDKEIVILDATQDGLHQIAQALAGRSGIDALHIISHGGFGAVNLGAVTLNSDSLASQQAVLGSIGASISPSGDILFYGCDVGASDGALIDQLRLITGADVAASEDLTGAEKYGGDWELEIQRGSIETAIVVNADLAATYAALLSISSKTVNFNGASALYGGTNANADLSYAIPGYAGYTLVINGQNQGIGHYGANSYITASYSNLETSVTMSFQGNQVFSPTSIRLGSGGVMGGQNQTVTITGYGADGSVKASASQLLTGNSPTLNTVVLGNFTSIKSLKLTTTDHSGKLLYFQITDLALTNVLPPDTTPPAAPGQPDLAPADDSGTSTSDNITNKTTPLLSGSGAEAGSTVKLYDTNGTTVLGTATANGSGNWSVTTSTLSSGTHTLTAKAIDSSGNVSTASPGLTVTVDTSAPGTTVAGTVFSADTGASASDFVTTTASQTITATLSGALGAGDIVYGSLDNGSTWIDITAKVSGTTLTWDNVTLSGSNTLKLKVTDSAGNDGAVMTHAYTLDTSAPTASSTPDMTSGTDTGSSNSDNLTGNTTPTFTGTAEAGSTVTLYDTNGTTVLGTTTATGGTWSITSSVLSAGSHTVTAKVTDVAGNISLASSGLSTTVDNTAPVGIGLSATTVTSNIATSTTTLATISATDTQAITYSLAPGNGTNDADNGNFTVSGTSLKVGGASLTSGTYKIYLAATDAAGNVANQAFTITVVDAPSVSSIVRSGGASATVNGAASSLSYTVTFSETVTGVDASDFTLTATGTASGSIASVAGSGTTYTVTVGNVAGDGTLRLDLNSSSTGIQNGSNVAITSGYTSGSSYTLDHTAPTAPSAPDMTSGTDTGSSSSDNLTSNATPTFSGTAESGSTVTLYDTDGTTVLGTATATGGNWSITSSALSAGGHTVAAKSTDAAGNVSSASGGLAVTVDTSAPTIVSVDVPANGAYAAGQVLNFTVHTSEAVAVDTAGGVPRIALVIGASTVYANYASGSGTNVQVYTYTVQAGDTDTNGIAIGALSSNGGTLKDTAGNSLNATLNSVGSTGAVLVDTTAPDVNSVTVPANGTYYSNQPLDLTVNFSENVTVDTTNGTPRIAITLDTGGTVYANYLSGNGTNALVFRHLVANGEADATGITVGALSANGGTLRDAGGNAANLTLNSMGSTALVNVDANMPQVTGVASNTANGSYKAGTTISVSIDFSKAITVDTTGGTPTLTLNSGGSASYTGGSGTSTLVFSYTVAAGQNSADLDYASTGALALNGATIRGSTGSHLDATLILATPGSSGSLGSNQAIVIDTVAPASTISGIAFSGDTGDSTTDFITSVTAQTVSAILSAGLSANEKLFGSVNNGGTWTDITAMVTGTSVTWSGVTLGTETSALQLKVTDAAGNDGAVLTKSYTVDTTAPVFQAATVDGKTVFISYTEASVLDAVNTPVAGNFTVTAGNAAIAVNAVTVNATTKTVTLTLASAVSSGQAVTVAYTDPTGGNDINAIQDTAGNDAATLAASNVTNNTPAPPASPSPPPTLTIDGVSVQTGTVINADGTTSTTIIIPVVTSARSEQVGNNNVADIPLATTSNGSSVLTALVPTGFGLTVAGPSTSKTAGTSVTDLMREIKAHTEAGSHDQNTLTDSGSGFLGDLPTNTPLLVQTIMPTVGSKSTAPTEPLVIAGSPQTAGNPLTALVIDTRGLPSGTVVALQNVEFAAIIGSATITGGAGSQNVWGDGSNQSIVLGADDDILHGGAGDDTVGSAGGNDRIFGDDGNDLVFGGAGNDAIDGGTGVDTVRMVGSGRTDYTLRAQNGKIIITHRNGGIDGTDTVSNVEKLLFTGAEPDMTARGTITRLYDTLFARTPDAQGLDFWVRMSNAGMSMHDIAKQLLASAESKVLLATHSNAQFVDSLYQKALGRAAAEVERDAWVAILDQNKADRADLLYAFADSAEKRALEKTNGVTLDFSRTDVATLVRLYDTLFDRKADHTGLNYWIAASEDGVAMSDIAVNFIQIAHAQPLFSSMNNSQFIEYLYKTGLERQGSTEEISAWAGQLDKGVISRGDALLGFAESAEKIGLIGVISTSIETI